MKKLKEMFIPCQENNFRPRILEGDFLFYFFVILLGLKLIAISFLIYFPNNIFFADVTKFSLLSMTNEERQFSGLSNLKENPLLSQAAYLKAKDMLDKNYFSHYSPQGLSPWYWFKAVGYDYKFAGENLAIGFLDSEEVHKSWIASPGHRDNILNPNYKEVGISVVRGSFGGNEVNLVVQLFGSLKAPAEKTIPVIARAEEKNTQAPELESVEGAAVSPEDLKPKEAEEEMAREIIPEIKEKEVGKNLTIGFLSFMNFNYFDLIQKLVYALLALMILFLIINIFVRFDIQHPDLIFKGLGFVALLILFIFLDRGVVSGLIPHSLIIK